MRKSLLIGAVFAASLALGASAQAQVKLGVAGPMTGPNAAIGAQFKNGVDMAVKDINAAGGVQGQQLSVAIGDDASDPKQGVSVANKFVGDGVTWVVGHYNSGVTTPASNVYADNGVIEITPGSTAEVVTERGLWNIFRTCGRDDQQAKVWSDYALANYKGKKIAIVHDKTTYGQGLADVAKKNLNAAGVKEAVFEGINVGEKDYSAIATKLKSAGVDLLIYGGLYTEAALILKQLRDQGSNTVMLTGDGVASGEFATIGGDSVLGTLMTFQPRPEEDPANAGLVKKFEATGFRPETYTLYAYASVQILKQAADESKSVDPQKIAEVMHSGKAFKTVLGELSYDKKGDLTKAGYVLYTWKKGADGKLDYTR
ncbi:branched-chain amino acid ABC transporter substrate-binding protein [Labrys neptuniae]